MGFKERDGNAHINHLFCPLLQSLGKNKLKSFLPKDCQLNWFRLEMRIRTMMATHPGRVRGHNEDAVGMAGAKMRVVLQQSRDSHVAADLRKGCFVVSDGLGGENGGGTASLLIVELLLEGWNRHRMNLKRRNEKLRQEHMVQLIEESHCGVRERAKEEEGLAGMGATASMVWFDGRQCQFAHVGDSRIYLCSRGTIVQLTDDDTSVWDAWKAGQISVELMCSHPERHILNQVVGGLEKNPPKIQTGAFRLHSGDFMLICSDGLCEGLNDSTIAEILEGGDTFEDTGFNLLEQSLESSGKDNTSFILAKGIGWF